MIAALLTGIAASPWMRAALRYGAMAIAVKLFLLSFMRAGERAGRIAERLENMEKANTTHGRTLDAAAPVPLVATSFLRSWSRHLVREPMKIAGCSFLRSRSHV